MSLLGITQARLALYLKAEQACLLNQSYTIKDRTFTRADLDVLRRTIDRLEEKIEQIKNGGIGVRQIIPRDG